MKHVGPPEGKRWVIYRIRVEINTDATVADRVLEIRLYSTLKGVRTMIYDLHHVFAVTASLTRYCNLGERRLDSVKADTDEGNHIYGGIEPMLLDSATADDIELYLRNGVAGDNYEGQLTVIEHTYKKEDFEE